MCWFIRSREPSIRNINKPPKQETTTVIVREENKIEVSSDDGSEVSVHINNSFEEIKGVARHTRSYSGVLLVKKALLGFERTIEEEDSIDEAQLKEYMLWSKNLIGEVISSNKKVDLEVQAKILIDPALKKFDYLSSCALAVPGLLSEIYDNYLRSGDFYKSLEMSFITCYKSIPTLSSVVPKFLKKRSFVVINESVFTLVVKIIKYKTGGKASVGFLGLEVSGEVNDSDKIREVTLGPQDQFEKGIDVLNNHYITDVFFRSKSVLKFNKTTDKGVLRINNQMLNIDNE